LFYFFNSLYIYIVLKFKY